jgi:hypothetical protein
MNIILFVLYKFRTKLLASNRLIKRGKNLTPLAYPGIFFRGGGGGSKNSVRTERTEIWGQ